MSSPRQTDRGEGEERDRQREMRRGREGQIERERERDRETEMERGGIMGGIVITLVRQKMCPVNKFKNEMGCFLFII